MDRVALLYGTIHHIHNHQSATCRALFLPPSPLNPGSKRAEEQNRRTEQGTAQQSIGQDTSQNTQRPTTTIARSSPLLAGRTERPRAERNATNHLETTRWMDGYTHPSRLDWAFKGGNWRMRGRMRGTACASAPPYRPLPYATRLGSIISPAPPQKKLCAEACYRCLR